MGWKVRERLILSPVWTDGETVGIHIGSHDPVSATHTDMFAVTRDAHDQKRWIPGVTSKVVRRGSNVQAGARVVCIGPSIQLTQSANSLYYRCT